MEIINQDLTKFSTIRTKSLAEYYCEAKSIPELKEAIKFKNSKNLSIVIQGMAQIFYSQKKNMIAYYL